MQKTKHINTDLVVVVAPGGVSLLLADGRIRLLTRLTVAVLERANDPDAVIGKVITRTVARLEISRLLLSVLEGTPHDALVVPVFDSLSTLSDDSGLPLLWLPDLDELVAKARQQHDSHSSEHRL